MHIHFLPQPLIAYIQKYLHIKVKTPKPKYVINPDIIKQILYKGNSHSLIKTLIFVFYASSEKNLKMLSDEWIYRATHFTTSHKVNSLNCSIIY